MKEYLDLIYGLYPANMDPGEFKYSYTKEVSNLWALINRAREENHTFNEMISEVYKELNCVSSQDFSLRGIPDLCRKSLLKLPIDQRNQKFPFCVVNIGVVVKYYFVYFTTFHGGPINTFNKPVSQYQQDMIDEQIVPIIKKYYPDYEGFPMQFIDERVPDVYSFKECDVNATYFECLLTNDIL